MRVLIVGEGKHELGERFVREHERGALETLVRRLVGVPIDCECDCVGRSDLHVHHGKGRGYLKKAIAWMRAAEKRGFDAVVFVIDQDKCPERIRELNAAQEHLSITQIRRAMGVAIRTFDAWMLADEPAVSAVLGASCSASPIRKKSWMASQSAPLGSKAATRTFRSGSCTRGSPNKPTSRSSKHAVPEGSASSPAVSGR